MLSFLISCFGFLIGMLIGMFVDRIIDIAKGTDQKFQEFLQARRAKKAEAAKNVEAHPK